MNVMAFSSRYVLCLFRISRSSQSRSTRILLLQDLACETIHDFELIQRKPVECPPFLVLSARSLSMSSRTNKGMLSIGFRSKEDGVIYEYNERARTQALESGYPFQSLALLLRLYTSRNPSLGGNRLGMVP
jgi:hypothetical protein